MARANPPATVISADLLHVPLAGALPRRRIRSGATTARPRTATVGSPGMIRSRAILRRCRIEKRSQSDQDGQRDEDTCHPSP
jgi:hypothetical protein